MLKLYVYRDVPYLYEPKNRTLLEVGLNVAVDSLLNLILQGCECLFDIPVHNNLVEGTTDFLVATVDEDAGTILRLAVLSQLLNSGTSIQVFVQVFLPSGCSATSLQIGM
ncbi:hypothetical protein [Rothia sp. ZJ932]|uniref:hypothetical protein n=1 Tax=Rothia sp. ZJ932 TaxID=2810516 RepID=UPI001967309C|nr:hypothetical protein [Rothia sp. ZJ932]QRZ61444.1 hypothetical protein JR346_09515 [Rothia sp. ZJ932]